LLSRTSDSDNVELLWIGDKSSKEGHFVCARPWIRFEYTQSKLRFLAMSLCRRRRTLAWILRSLSCDTVSDSKVNDSIAYAKKKFPTGLVPKQHFPTPVRQTVARLSHLLAPSWKPGLPALVAHRQTSAVHGPSPSLPRCSPLSAPDMQGIKLLGVYTMAP